MESVRRVAMYCVGRAVMFGALAISLVMLSFAFDPAAACKLGGVAGLLVAAILLWFHQTARSRPPARTETFLLLPESERPHNDHARKAFGIVMEEVYLYYATRAFTVGSGLLLAGIGLAFAGVQPGF
jgi:hypothetical protein